jgi:allantoicase
MGDGWETARQPLRPACYKRQADGLMLLPGQDWAMIKCGKNEYIVVLCKNTLLLLCYAWARYF